MVLRGSFFGCPTPKKPILPQISILGMGFEVFLIFFVGFFVILNFLCNFLSNSTTLKTKPLLNSGYNFPISNV